MTLNDIRKVMDDFKDRTGVLPNEARTSAWFLRRIRRELGLLEDAKPQMLPSTSLTGIPVVIDPAVPEGEFHWVLDGKVIGKIVVDRDFKKLPVMHPQRHSDGAAF